MTILTFIWPLWPWPTTYLKNVSNSTFPPQWQQLCQIVLKSMHYCTSYGPDKSGRMQRCTDIQQTKIVTTMSLYPQDGSKKIQNKTLMHLQQTQLALALLLSKLVRHIGTEKYPAPLQHPITPLKLCRHKFCCLHFGCFKGKLPVYGSK